MFILAVMRGYAEYEFYEYGEAIKFALREFGPEAVSRVIAGDCALTHCFIHDGKVYRQDAPPPDLLATCEALVNYRDRAGALNFQLEKADDFINAMRVAIAAATGRK